MAGLEGHKAVTADSYQSGIKYSICTLATRTEEYIECTDSFKAKGFTQNDCEFLYIDNSKGNSLDAFSGYNLFLQMAAGKYIILCHQDILLIDDGREKLDQVLAELDRIDPHWGLCGNAGASEDDTLTVRITDPYRTNGTMGGPLPAPVVSLDENFIVVRRSANLALSRDLSGFHFYGAELCIIADILGYKAYVIDFHLQHKSGGNIDKAFGAIRESLIEKYRRAFRSRWIHLATRRSFYITSSPAAYFLARVRRKLSRLLGR